MPHKKPTRPKRAAGRKKVMRKRAALKLEDNPRYRYQELMADRHSGRPPDPRLSRLRTSAIEDTADMVPVHEKPTTPAGIGGNNWVPLGPKAIPGGQALGGSRVVVTGRVTAIAPHPTDPHTIYVAAARGGIWKTSDDGTTWSPISDNAVSLAIGALALAPSNPQVLYAGTGEGNILYYAMTAPFNAVNESYSGSGMLRSSDGGVTWNTQGTDVFVGACFYRIAVHPANADVAFAASSRGLFRTVDAGEHWTPVTNGLPTISSSVIAATDIVFDPQIPDTAYVGFWASGIYKTSNANASNPTWAKLAQGLPSSGLGRISIAISPTSPQVLYALIANLDDSLNGLFTSSNAGSSWSSIGAAKKVVKVYGAYTSNVAVDVSTPNIVYVSGLSLYKGVNTSGTWMVNDIGQLIHADNHAFTSHPSNHLVLYAGNDGGVYRSSDGGSTWDDSFNEGLTITQFEFIDQHPASDAVIIGGTQDNGTSNFGTAPLSTILQTETEASPV